MIKRAGNILVLLLLLIGTTGVTITRHYCGSKLVGSSFYKAPQHCCNGVCPFCHDEKVEFRITDNFESSQSQVNCTAGFKTLLERHSLPTLLTYSANSNFSLFNDAPQDRSVKPYSINPIFAGHSTPFLQVFLF